MRIIYIVFILGLFANPLQGEVSKDEVANELQVLGYEVLRVTNAGDNVLHSAVKKQNFEAVQLAIAYGINPNRTNKAGDTPLHLAAEKGNLEIATYLIQSGASMEITNNLGQTPYHKAISKNHADVAAYFESMGYPAENSLDDVLLSLGERPDYVDNQGNTLVHRLVKKGNVELLREVLENGYSPYTFNKKGESPLTLATKQEDLEIATLLIFFQRPDRSIISRIDLEAAARQGWEEGFVLYFASLKNSVSEQSWNFLMNFANQKGIALIHYACYGGNLEIVRLLVEEGANVNQLTQSEMHYGRDDPIYWGGDDWLDYGELGNLSDLDVYTQDSGYVHPRATPLTIAERFNADNQELIDYLKSLGAEAKYNRSYKGETLEDYLKQ